MKKIKQAKKIASIALANDWISRDKEAAALPFSAGPFCNYHYPQQWSFTGNRGQDVGAEKYQDHPDLSKDDWYEGTQ